MLNILDLAPLQATTNSTAFTGWFPLFMSTGRLPSSVLIRQPQLPESLRICQYCRSNQIEDENHFLFHCGRCKTIRQQITSDIVLKYPSFYLLNNTDKTREFYAHRSMFSCTIRVRFPTFDFVASIAYFLSSCLLFKSLIRRKNKIRQILLIMIPICAASNWTINHFVNKTIQRPWNLPWKLLFFAQSSIGSHLASLSRHNFSTSLCHARTRKWAIASQNAALLGYVTIALNCVTEVTSVTNQSLTVTSI